MTTASKARMKATIPFLACEDIPAALSFYTSKLGFIEDWSWGTPPSDAGVSRDEISIYLARNPELASRISGSEIVIRVDDIDALYAEHQASRAPITSPLGDKPWGTREYSVHDVSGYILRFSS